ncbi:hypothetical protein JHK87_047991 [Glycine soja]|nr:hypothetical protein JHK87_047991 [Glycine soja]
MGDSQENNKGKSRDKDNCVIRNTFGRSQFATSENFHKILKVLNSLAPDLIVRPGSTVPAKIRESTRFYPYFKVLLYGEHIVSWKNHRKEELLLMSTKEKAWLRRSNLNRDYDIGESEVMSKVFNAFGAISAIIVCNTSGLLPGIQVLLYGEQIVSWKNHRKEELLFMSTKFDDLSSLEQHGFARNRMWSLDRDPSPLPPLDNESSVDLILKSTKGL